MKSPSDHDQDRRRQPRRRLALQGLLRLEEHGPLAVRVVDASADGLGVRHLQPLPEPGEHGRVFVHLVGSRGERVVEAEVELRHSDFTRREYESGLRIVAMGAVHRRLLDGVLAASGDTEALPPGPAPG